MQKNKKSKKTAIMLLSFLLAVTIVLGGTLAYLTSQTNREVNNFSFPKDSEGLSAMLTEPDWDGAIAYESVTDSSGNVSMIPIYDYTEEDNKPIYGYITDEAGVEVAVTDKSKIDSNVKRPEQNINSSDENTSKSYGIDVAEEMIPGATAYKNPMITNTGTVTDEWVAAKVTFVYTHTLTDKDGNVLYKSGTPLSDDDMRTLLLVVDIEYTNNWEQINASYDNGEIDPIVSQQGAVYYYKAKVAKNGGKTTPLFTKVYIKETVESGVYNSLGHLKETGFTIYVEGFAAQSSVAVDYEEFKAWGKNGGVVFNNTPTAGNAVDVSKTCLPA